MNFFGRTKGSRVPEQNDPDSDLASNAGFEIGVDTPDVPPPVEAPKGLFARFRKPVDEQQQQQQPPSPSFSVQEVQPSIKVTELHDDPPSDVSTEDEDADVDMEDGMTKATPMAAVGTGTQTMQERIREKRLAFEAWYHDEERQERWNKAAPYCMAITLVLLLAILLGLIFGLRQKEFGVPSAQGIGPATVNVLIEFDERPEEIGWKIFHLGTWDVVKEVKEGTYTSANGFINEDVALEWGKEYVFRITDAGSDGLSSGQTGRWVLAFRQMQIGTGNGDFGTEDSASFLMNEELGIVNVTGWQNLA